MDDDRGSSVITTDDYFMGRDVMFPAELTDALHVNAEVTVGKCNQLLEAFGEERGVNSGWRPPEINAVTKGASHTSYHMTCQACDIEDKDGELDAWCMANLDVLKKLGLWLEHPSSTVGWCHVQTVPPHSGNRVFYP